MTKDICECGHKENEHNDGWEYSTNNPNTYCLKCKCKKFKPKTPKEKFKKAFHEWCDDDVCENCDYPKNRHTGYHCPDRSGRLFKPKDDEKPKVNLYCKNPQCFNHYLANKKIKSKSKDDESLSDKIGYVDKYHIKVGTENANKVILVTNLKKHLKAFEKELKEEVLELGKPEEKFVDKRWLNDYDVIERIDKQLKKHFGRKLI